MNLYQGSLCCVRIPGGRLSSIQAKVLGECAKDFGNNYIDLTTRMQVELRYLHIEDIPEIFKRLENVGITTYQTGIDNLRNIVCDPLDGIALDNFIESYPILIELQNLFVLAIKDEVKFYYRYLNNFSNGAIAFLMKFNFYLKENGVDYRFSFSKHKPIGKFEPFEIFDFGNEIYKELTADKAYLEIYNFQPIGSSKPSHPSKINKNIPKNIGDIVYKMIHPNPNERYQVFSEILKDIEI